MVNIPYTEVFELELFGEKLGPLPKMQSLRGAQNDPGIRVPPPNNGGITTRHLGGHRS